MKLAAVHIANSNSIETARRFYRPILELGPSAEHWAREFLRAWVMTGLPLSKNHDAYTRIWKDMIEYVRTLPDWQPGSPGCWCPAEILAAELVGIDESSAAVLGGVENRAVVEVMASTFDDWGSQWLIYASVAQFYANFLVTDAGEVLLTQGIHQLAAVSGSFPEDDWTRYELGVLFAGTLSTAWARIRPQIGSGGALREAFLKLLTVLCMRNVLQAVNLRSKVTQELGAPS
jgi:hypothetical protein